MDVKQALIHSLEQLPPHVEQIYIAFSGGLDSTVLVHALAGLRQTAAIKSPLNLHLIHVHHGLSPNADDWVENCQQLAASLALPLTVVQVDARPKTGESPEAAARQARYKIFAETLPANAVLMLAHHANDQAETLLLQLLRGAGVRGLASMPLRARFHQSWLMRPLLAVSRVVLEQYAEQHQLTWIEDESNLNVDFDRNYLRHNILPLLNARWPATVSCLSRSASHCAEADSLLMEIADADLSNMLDGEPRLNILLLRTLSPPRLNNVVRYWLMNQGLPLPSTVKLQTLIQTLIYSRYDAMPHVSWPGVEVRRFRNYLYAMPPLPKHDPTWYYEWNMQEDLVLPANIGTLQVKDYLILAKGLPLRIAFRQGGEAMVLTGRKGHHSLKNLMQEWDIPPWLRQRVPLIFQNQELIAVVGYT